MRRIWILAAAALVVTTGIIVATVAWPRRNILDLPRASNGTDYVLYVHVPDRCRAGDCPALYLLDGERWLPTLARIEDQLVADARMRPVVIVGIGYRDIARTADLRKHDFTPAFGRQPGRTGGADAYLAVMRDEIIPYVEETLPVARGERAIAGHSYAGLFAVYALARAPDLFDRVLIMSPALWFDNGKIYNVELEPASGSRDVFLAADTPRGEARSAMANDVLRLNELLDARRDISVSHALIQGETHDSMVAPAAEHGLRTLFGTD